MRKWFYYWYFTVLLQPQLLKLTKYKILGSDRGPSYDRECWMVEHLFLKGIYYSMELQTAPRWWIGIKHYVMSDCFSKYWSIKGIKD